MDGEGYLRLDPDVAGSREGNRLPLSDLYGLPVFADDTQQKAGELHTKEKQMLEGIRQEVFENIRLAMARAEELHKNKKELCPKYCVSTVYLLLKKVADMLPEQKDTREEKGYDPQHHI